MKSFDLFAELIKMVFRTMEEAYEETQKFINLKKELKSVKKECSISPMVAREKGKIELSLENPDYWSIKPIKDLLGRVSGEEILE